jgi:hypothetical protein
MNVNWNIRSAGLIWFPGRVTAPARPSLVQLPQGALAVARVLLRSRAVTDDTSHRTPLLTMPWLDTSHQ